MARKGKDHWVGIVDISLGVGRSRKVFHGKSLGVETVARTGDLHQSNDNNWSLSLEQKYPESL